MQALQKNAELLTAGESLLQLAADTDIYQINAELVRARRTMSETLHKENVVLNQANEVICSIGTDYTILSINPACKKVWGYEPGELLGTKLRDIIPDEDQQHSMDSLIGAQKSVDTLSFESRIRRKNGELINMLWSAHWSLADRALFCVSHDITERKKAEKILEESEARLREIFTRLPLGLVICNNLGFIETCNPSMQEQYGYQSEDLLGKRISDICSSPSANLTDLALNKRIEHATIKSRTGAPYTCQISAVKLNTQDGDRLLFVLFDTTERTKVEQLKQAFFLMISHDLRSPLTSLLYVFERLKSGKLGELNENGKDLIDRNFGEVQRLVDLTSELLDIEKIRSGELPLSILDCKVSELLQSAETAVRGMAIAKNISIEYTSENISFEADRSLIIRVLVNLLSNAIKFSDAGEKIMVRVRKLEKALQIEVEDHGRGIPKELTQYIFEPFKQLDPSDFSINRGSGLGLAICKMIVERHAGTITVESQASKGSKFTVELPLLQTAPK